MSEMTERPEERTTEERLLHMPFEDDSTQVSGIRWCCICYEPWPCDIREGRRP